MKKTKTPNELHIVIAHPPLSLNNAFWNGKRGRYRTARYEVWKKQVFYQLPYLKNPLFPPPYSISYEFGVSNPLSVDTDNLVKTIQDTLSEKYRIKDRDFWQVTARKYRVEKGNEGIEIDIVPFKGECHEKIYLPKKLWSLS